MVGYRTSESRSIHHGRSMRSREVRGLRMTRTRKLDAACITDFAVPMAREARYCAVGVVAVVAVMASVSVAARGVMGVLSLATSGVVDAGVELSLAGATTMSKALFFHQRLRVHRRSGACPR